MNEDEKFDMFLMGDRIYLREVRSSDVNETYYRWMNDPEVTKCLESRYYPNSIESLHEYVKEKSGDPNTVFLAIITKSNNRYIGNIKLGPINWIHRFGDLGIVIGEKDCWGKGYASDAIGLAIRYAFETLNLHKLNAGCYKVNKGSQEAFQKNGFQIEGIRKKQYFLSQEYVDEVLLGLINQRNGINAE